MTHNGFLRLVVIAGMAYLTASCSLLKPVPQPEREFRGFWVATVVNIDWPKNSLDSVTKQKSDFLEILDFYQDLNFNAAIVQIRTAGDAFYESSYAPWSRFLTGEEGKPPTTEEDLLPWMIRQTHQRGMEFHAWLNPYRATFDLKLAQLDRTHDIHLHPGWILKYGGKYYYDPGLPEVQRHLAGIMAEVVDRYDVDGVHFDDYFYPYKIAGEAFQDSITYRAHHMPGQSLDDWRRSNVDSLVMLVHKTIKAKKPWVQFGVSPFGVWKNKTSDPRGSDTQAGQTTYEDLYADPLRWVGEGWVDYLVPQVYWSMDLEVASHRKIVKWWSDTIPSTNLYIGNGAYKIRNNSDKAWHRKRELSRQLRLARESSEVNGNVFFSAKSLMHGKEDVVDHLKRTYYKHQALPPVSPWVREKDTSPLPTVSMRSGKNHLTLTFHGKNEYRYGLVFPSRGRTHKEYPLKKLIGKFHIAEDGTISIPVEKIRRKRRLALTLIDRFGRQSKPIIVHLDQSGI